MITWQRLLLMGEWKETTLSSVVTSNNQSVGKNYEHEVIQYLDTGSITNGKIEGYQEINIDEAPSRAKRLVKNEDIIYSTVRPIQKHFGFIQNPVNNLVVSTGFSVIEVNTELANPKFIYYFLSSDETVEILDVIAEASTTTYPSLKPKDIESLDISLPSPEEQKAIAEVLSSLDDKIDLLHRQNKTLKELAQTLFRQWFIEEAKDEWDEVSLKEVCTIINGFAFKSGDYRDSGRMIIRTMNFENGFIDTSNIVYIDLEEEHKYAKQQLQENDFLLVMVGASLGKSSIVTSDVLPALQNQNMWNFRSLGNISQHYLNFALRQIIENNMGSASGSAREFFQKGQFYEFLITVPDNEKMTKFENYAEDFYSKITKNREQIKTLENMRNTLLSKLMSGEVRVRINNKEEIKI